VADHFRRPETRRHIVDFQEADDLPAPSPAGEESIVVREMNSCMREVIDSLPGDYRAALVLHDLEGMTAKAVAEICKCSLATAKIRIHRGRLRLKAALEEECSFYHDDESVLRCDRKDD
jgi:RNA polymerase sigma-70 factor (ECF subfamily)